MNIFVVDSNPIIAAQSLIDCHIVKMPIEAGQLLANVFTHQELISAPPTRDGQHRKYTNPNHPCALWVKESLQNFQWLLLHGVALCQEYTYRYNKEHYTTSFLLWCSKQSVKLPSIGITSFALAMPDTYKQHNTIDAYRQYYINEKLKLSKVYWTKRQPPNWILPFTTKRNLK